MWLLVRFYKNICITTSMNSIISMIHIHKSHLPQPFPVPGSEEGKTHPLFTGRYLPSKGHVGQTNHKPGDESASCANEGCSKV